MMALAGVLLWCGVAFLFVGGGVLVLLRWWRAVVGTVVALGVAWWLVASWRPQGPAAGVVVLLVVCWWRQRRAV